MQVHEPGADPKVGDAVRRGPGVLGQHHRDRVRREERFDAGRVGLVGDDVEVEPGLRGRAVLLGDDGAEADDDAVGRVAQRLVDVVVVAVAEAAGDALHGAATVGRRDHVEPHERAVSRSFGGDEHVVGEDSLDRLVVTRIENTHDADATGTCTFASASCPEGQQNDPAECHRDPQDRHGVDPLVEEGS